MKLYFAVFAILCLVLVAVPAWANYENGPVNGTTDAWTINFGYIVSDTFTETTSTTIIGFTLYVWEFPGDATSQVDWSITSGENGGTVYGSGTAKGKDTFISTNQYGYDIDSFAVTGLNVFLNPGTYWLNIQNASVASGDPVYWDENSGAGCKSPGCPSQASESAVGTIPSEAFAVTEQFGCGAGNNSSPDCGPPSPEPASILLFGSGVLALAGVLHRKLHF